MVQHTALTTQFGMAMLELMEFCNGFEQHSWRCFALSGQDYPSLRPAFLIQILSHTKLVHPHKEWQEIAACGSCDPTTRMSAFILILTSQSMRKGRGGTMQQGTGLEVLPVP